MEKIVQEYYQEYKFFVNDFSLPPINPVFNMNDKIHTGTLAYINIDEIMKSPINIYIDSKLFLLNKQVYKSVLFHEFTHILDGVYTLTSINDDKKFDKLMATYSEYHASQIELLCVLGYTKLPIVKKFKLSSKIYNEDRMVDVEHYLIQPLSSAIEIANHEKRDYINLSDLEFNKRYILLRNKTLYYLGKYNVCEKYAITRPCNLFDNYSIFKEDVLELYKCLKVKDFEKIIEAENKFMLHFIDYFYVQQ